MIFFLLGIRNIPCIENNLEFSTITFSMLLGLWLKLVKIIKRQFHGQTFFRVEIKKHLDEIITWEE